MRLLFCFVFSCLALQRIRKILFELHQIQERSAGPKEIVNGNIVHVLSRDRFFGLVVHRSHASRVRWSVFE